MDDFVIVAKSKKELYVGLDKIKKFISTELNLALAHSKTQIKKFDNNGKIDFVGFIHRPFHIDKRMSVVDRILNIRNPSYESINSYFGMCSKFTSTKTKQMIGKFAMKNGFTIDWKYRKAYRRKIDKK